MTKEVSMYVNDIYIWKYSGTWMTLYKNVEHKLWISEIENMIVSVSKQKKKKKKAISRSPIRWDGEGHVSQGIVMLLCHNDKKFVTRDKFRISSRNKNSTYITHKQ